MSRHVRNPDAERAAQNQATIKSLLKLEPNKVCADCKRNKHPRWASWNLGIFVCIRCSGIHRGMGTHISRVKSVDLDSWTDEQLQSILSWGNARANKYWESKLNPGHCPSEAKMENFIRTKYELKRWVMDGPMPDPSTLDVDGDDDVPLSLVKEKQAIERKASIRRSSVGKSQSPQGDLIGSDDAPLPPRTGTTRSPVPRGAPKAEPAEAKTTTATASTRDSLLGLDFLGGGASAPPRPASTPSTGGLSRPDLKQSILSLYASTATKPQPQQQPMQHAGAMGGGPLSPTMSNNPQPGGGLGDAMGSLSISPDPFASLGGASSNSRTTPQPWSGNAFGGLSGGSFFDSKPTQPPAAPQQPKSLSSMFGGSSSFSPSSPTATTTAAAPKPASSAMDDLFDFSSPAPQTTTATTTSPTGAAPTSSATSVFNLSGGGSQQKPPTQTSPLAATAASAMGASGMSGANNPWGGNEWSTLDAATTTKTVAPAAASRSPEPAKSPTAWGGGASFGGGGANPPPKVTADEEFGGWASSAGPAGGTGTAPAAAPKSGGFGGDDDLFSNVWQ
ncbi:hypothetical protein XA68_14243 [Ophiocordyceps unilateralis]|uniref:Arf-GAP domain-containing protein n=1 Tax=Ophiocordyceps unilateralis TaxID=268505 RepID=A0A2A9PB01_OPHUN|nr:hypothetical protein XA68_14243 [Ophiocordyceps unilateralis]